MAADSGGFTVRNTNDLASGFKRIADETRAYYLIGYNPTNTARDGLFRKIQVKVPGREGSAGPGPQGLLRSVRPEARGRAEARAWTPSSRRPSTRRTRWTTFRFA